MIRDEERYAPKKKTFLSFEKLLHSLSAAGKPPPSYNESMSLPDLVQSTGNASQRDDGSPSDTNHFGEFHEISRILVALARL